VRPRTAFVLLFGAVLAARLCHLRILWIEECYPAAGAIQILYGMVPYRDFWFDKPPLAPLLYLLWDAQAGFPLRLAGAVFVTLAAWLAWRFASQKWGPDEGLLAAGLVAFFLTFGLPSSVMALAPDLLMIVPHLAAAWLAWRGRPFLAGLAAGAALLVHTKGFYVLAVCLLWQWRAAHLVLAGFLLPNAVALAALGAAGALPGYWQQVWQWGWLYARDTFVENPLGEGIRRTLNWAGFHAAAVLAAAWHWRRERDPDSRRLFAWALISLAGVAAGLRFFPRYYLQLLPVVALAGARGFTLLGRRRAAMVGLLLLVPLVRFGPRYAILAADLATGHPHRWRDLAMYEGSRQAAAILNGAAPAEDTLLVWGYRPDIWVLTRRRAGTPYLDSQPLTGVIADRHLFDSRPSAPELAARNRAALTRYLPNLIVDGLGPYNPSLAITRFPDLEVWLRGNYREIARTPSAVIYRLRSGAGLRSPRSPASAGSRPAPR